MNFPLPINRILLINTFAFIGLFLFSNSVQPSTYYIATNGNDNYQGSLSAPWATFEHAYLSMSGGDTLIIRNGFYDQVITTDRTYDEEILSSYGDGIPDGSQDAYTVIKAEHDWGVILADQLTLSPSKYVHIQGIHFKEGGYLSGSDHIKIIRCSFKGTVCEDNTTVICAGTGCSYILFEECFAYGCGRYKFMAYGDQNVPTEKIIFRRCVSRHDYHYPNDNWGQQCATFTSYDCHDLLMQNCISINSGEDNPLLYGNLYGGIWFENKQTTGEDNSGVIQGCIFLDLGGLGVITDPNNNGNRVLENCVIWDSKGGYGGGVRSGNPTLLLNHLTIGNIWGEFQDQSYSWGTGVYCSNGFSSQHLTNSIITNCNSYGIADYVNSDYNNYYDIISYFGNTYQTPTPIAGTHDRFENPGLKYICRVEDDSPIKNAASDGGNMGATVLKRYGVSGTLWGEQGYNELQNESLWPFPNEAEIKRTMSSWEGQNNPKRGFCEDDESLNGTPITLTSYIWEYLGYPCPSEIYGPVASTNIIKKFNSILIRNYPNPFKLTTNLEFYLEEPADVTIEIYSIIGTRVKTIRLENTLRGINLFSIAMNDFVEGIYTLQLITNNNQYTHKIEVLR